MSEISVNSILDANGGATTTINGFTPTVSNMAGRNRIINGDMRISQRNAEAAVTHSGGSNLYVLDRFVCNSNGTPQFSVQRVADAPAGFTFSSKLTTTTAGTPAAGDFSYYGQYIEGFNVADLSFGTASAATVTISFWVKSSLTGSFSGSLRNAGNNRSYPFSYNISTADTWEQKSVTISGDTTGTWATDASVGMTLFFDTGSGVNNKGAANAWNATANVGVTGAVNLVATSGATFYITGVQLEAGSVATPFEHRQYGQELALCQRYYERVYINNSMPIAVTHCYAPSAAYGVYVFKVDKRSTPTGVTSGTFIALTSNGATAGGSLSFSAITVSAARLEISGATGLVAGNASSVWGDTNPMIAFSSEL